MKLKHLVTLCFFAFSVSIALAQKPEKVKTKTKTKTETNKALNSKLTYQVLKSDKDIKHGDYKMTNTFYKQVIVSGSYNHGRKDGLWEEWVVNSSKLKSKGVYNNGKKIGVWEYSDILGKPLHTYNYKTNTLLFDSSCGKNYPRKIIQNGEQVSSNLDCVPDLLGGISSIFNAIEFISFFGEKQEDTAEIVSINVSILVKKDGTIGDVLVETPFINPDFISAIKSKLNNPELIWIPGKLDGKNVDAYISYSHSITIL